MGVWQQLNRALSQGHISDQTPLPVAGPLSPSPAPTFMFPLQPLLTNHGGNLTPYPTPPCPVGLEESQAPSADEKLL